MPITIKSKISTGIGLLFALLLTISIVAFVFINLLSNKTENLLTANYKTIQYCNQMMHAMDAVHSDNHATDSFEKNLRLQENNITEQGEGAATQRLRVYFELMKKGDNRGSIIDSINKQLYDISILNQHALEAKNIKALKAAQNAKLWISILSVIVILVGFTFAVNFPGYIASPLRMLTEGIREISNKNYNKRIYLKNKDEFGELAQAFNKMAEKLYDFEHSNISKLMFEKKRVETIINQMEDAVIGLDFDGKLLFINHMAEGLFHLKGAAITGKYAPDIAIHNDLLRTVLQKDVEKQPLKIIVEGKESYFIVDNRTVYNENQSIGEVFTLRDITSFKELDISKTNLLATISHELKTPISSIKMSTKLITDERIGVLNTEQKELVHNINEDADRLLRITGELLNMTQIETGNIQLRLQKVSPKEIVDQSIQVVQLMADQKKIKLQVNFADNLPAVTADEDKTSWVLINLLTNAIKYTPEEGTIIITIQPDNSHVKFIVQDFGPGIESKYISRIFDRYFKVPGSVEKTSTGLGLAISKEFIEAQGGTINAKSEIGKGSTFSFILPA